MATMKTVTTIMVMLVVMMTAMLTTLRISMVIAVLSSHVSMIVAAMLCPMHVLKKDANLVGECKPHIGFGTSELAMDSEADWAPMQSSNPVVCAAFIKSLFPPLAAAERPKNDHERLCATQGEDDIRWDNFITSWDLQSVQDVVRGIYSRPDTDYAYIGVTTCPVWRWSTCDGYNNMKPHKSRFDSMEIILVEHAEPVTVLEEMMIEYARELGHDLANALHYAPGPINHRNKMFLYICVKRLFAP